MSVGIDLEQEFVNHLAVQGSLEYVLREGVSNDLLVTPKSKSVYQFVQHHFNQSGKIPSTKVLNVEFPKIEFLAPEATVEWVVDKLRQRYQQTQVTALTMELARQVEKPAEAMKYLRDQVFAIERNSLSSRHIWTPGDHKIFLRDMQQKVLAGNFKGVSIGFPEIDKFTGGVKKGNVAYVLARPKRKKTFIVLNAFIAQVQNDEEPFLYTLENTEEEVMLRISCMLSGYPWDQAQKGQFMPKDWKLLDKAWEDFSQHKFWIEMPPMDERTVPAMTLKADKVGAKSIVISQFHYIQGLKEWYPQDYLKAAEVAVDLKRAAVRPGKERPILVEAQFNRGGDSMEELEDFDASKVGLTDMIPQSADTLYGLFQNKDMRQNNVTEFGILDARSHDKAAWFVETELRTRTEFRLQAGSQH